MFYWGGSSPGTYQCACGVSDKEPCISSSTTCNCDTGESGTSDGGYLTQKQYLPVMELHFGDTGTLTDDKVGQFQLGQLECFGDSEYSSISFTKRNTILSCSLSIEAFYVKI